MACVSKIGSLYEMVTKNVIVSTTNTVFGINPRAWIALPCEGLILLKIRQVVPTAGSALPVQIAVPANSTVSTVGADTCCPVTGVNVVNPINVAVTGAAMVMYLDDPDAPEGVAFIRWLAVQDYLGEKINWKDLT